VTRPISGGGGPTVSDVTAPYLSSVWGVNQIKDKIPRFKALRFMRNARKVIRVIPVLDIRLPLSLSFRIS
jgi:hypothetical protein